MKFAKENNSSDCSTTLALVILFKDRLHAFNLGDSRIYLIRNGKVNLLSEDDTQLQSLANDGKYSQEYVDSIKSSPAGSSLNAYVGRTNKKDRIALHPQEIKIEINDILLLCTDGIVD